MRTISRLLFTVALVVFIAAQGISQIASTTVPEKTKATVANGQHQLTDANKNGVCDNFEAKKAGAPGKNFTDKNGDGKCDNQCSQGKGKGNCCGAGLKCGQGCGKGQGCGQSCGNGQGKGGNCGNGHQHRNGGACQNKSNSQPVK